MIALGSRGAGRLRPSGLSGVDLRLLIWTIFLIGAAALTIQRAWLLTRAPLWLDETWTGAIVSPPRWGDFAHEVYLDVNAPLYYLLIHLWQKIAGLSDLALRLPSLIFVTGAGLAPLIWRTPGLSRPASLLWASLLLAWWPGVAMSIDARAYGLLLLVSTLQAIAFVRLLHRPGRRDAFAWCGLGSLAILTHYFSLFAVAAQGLAYLLRHRRLALRTWPAALLFLPAFLWLAIHAPRLIEYARPDVAWYPLISWASVPPYLRFAIGQSTPWLAAAMILIILVAARWPATERDEPLTPSAHLWLAVLAGVAVLILLLAVGAARPMLTLRYLTPIVPCLLLGIVLAARQARRAHLAFAGLATLFMSASLKPAVHSAGAEHRSVFGLSRASDRLLRLNPDRVVIALDVGAMKVR
jgi:uncharacterized membrane protein